MSDNLVTLENLKYYDQRLNDKLESKYVHKEAYDEHTHDMRDIRTSKMYTYTTQPDQIRLSSYRKCQNNPAAIHDVHLSCRDYDMFYLTLTGNATIYLDNDRTDADTSSDTLNTFARHIKVIIKNPSTGTITWPSSVVWMNGEEPTYTAGANKVDVIDLFTPDGNIWFANALQSWTIN